MKCGELVIVAQGARNECGRVEIILKSETNPMDLVHRVSLDCGRHEQRSAYSVQRGVTNARFVPACLPGKDYGDSMNE